MYPKTIWNILGKFDSWLFLNKFKLQEPKIGPQEIAFALHLPNQHYRLQSDQTFWYFEVKYTISMIEFAGIQV